MPLGFVGQLSAMCTLSCILGLDAWGSNVASSAVVGDKRHTSLSLPGRNAVERLKEPTAKEMLEEDFDEEGHGLPVADSERQGNGRLFGRLAALELLHAEHDTEIAELKTSVRKLRKLASQQGMVVVPAEAAGAFQASATPRCRDCPYSP
eukprot:TRINITY_DN55621_c0_g1_i1.p1 TRINITY_DN55621_c0_g1~~TRINITY_DN55621_c0_g1_i1.p1  ORF type:complete len:167 (+),score=27.81 TRINITY_DN55621_c0_g1_i1:53-502(+)